MEPRKLIDAFGVGRSFVCLFDALTNGRIVVGYVGLELRRCAIVEELRQSVWKIFVAMLREYLSAEDVEVADFHFIFVYS